MKKHGTAWRIGKKRVILQNLPLEKKYEKTDYYCSNAGWHGYVDHVTRVEACV